MQTNIRQRAFVDRNERFSDSIHECIGPDESGPRVSFRLRDQILRAAESDLEPQIIDRRCK